MTRIAIIIPSLGRSEVLSKTLTLLAAQSRPADHICVVVTNPEDAPTIPDTGNIDVLYAAIGSCAQRNAGIDQTIGASDIITFLDDDFVPSSDYLETLVEIFTTRPEIAGLTGHVLADGVIGPGLSFEDADRILDNRHNPQSRARQKETREPSLYGCNMSFRRSAIEDVRFDERLPFYGWLEDVDFSVQAGRRGHLIKTPRLQGVHLGVKGGRTSG
ncbi:MAG: glycosyltransferase, partial [Pseudomonadota bacterium]